MKLLTEARIHELEVRLWSCTNCGYVRVGENGDVVLDGEIEAANLESVAGIFRDIAKEVEQHS